VAVLLADGSVLLPGSGRPSERWTPTTTLGAPGEAGFGPVQVGNAGAVTAVPVTNTGSSPLLVDAAAVDGDFTLVDDRCTRTVVAPGSTCTIGLRFGPLAAGERTGVLRVEANTAQRTHTITLRGEGAAAPAVTPQPVPTAAPRPSPTAVATATPRAAPAPMPVVEIRFRSRYSPSGVPAAKASKGKVTLALRRGKRVIDRAAARLDRRCRYTATFSF
jgi:hypothetical protein